MYHNIYPTWLVTNPSGKNPFIFTYGDMSFVSLDNLSPYLPAVQQQFFALPQLTIDAPNMKRIPINTLMQSMESGNLPFLRRRNINQSGLNRQVSKESLAESGYEDSGVSSSRSSTPSSVDTSTSNVTNKASPSNTAAHSEVLCPRRKYEHKYAQIQNLHQQFHYNQKAFIPKHGVSSRKIKDEWHAVSLGIWNHYIKNRQLDDMYVKKMNLRAAVHSLLWQKFPNCGLRVVGSSVNGLGTNTSDVDMCLVLSMMEIDQQTEAMHLLKHAQRLLNHCSFVKSTELITAKVPILKFTEKYSNIQVDLNVNNTVGITNTQLLGAYSQLDWRVPPLVLIIKKWAQDCQINNAKEMTLSSYSLVLMVIHYLQCGCVPAVLPCLQKMHSRRHEFSDYWQLIPYTDRVAFHSLNKQSLGGLLFGFFEYYADKFDFEKDVISVRLGCKLPKQVAMNFISTKNKRGHWKFVCIEEPFNRTNTACAVYDKDSFNRILCAFKRTWLHMNSTKELVSILST